MSRRVPMVLELPAEGRAALRQRAANAIEWLLCLLDALDADPDLEPAGDESEPDDNGLADLDAIDEHEGERLIIASRYFEHMKGDPAAQARKLLEGIARR